MTDYRFKDKVVLIAGGAKNLGGLLSREVGREGAKVVVHYNSDATRSDAEDTVKAVKDLGGDAYMTQGDLTRPANVERSEEHTSELQSPT